MFGIFKSKDSQTDQALKTTTELLVKMGAQIALITQSGKIIYTSEKLSKQPKDWLGGQVMEVMIATPNSNPYFIYYENESYYFKLASSRQSITTLQECEAYRSQVSQTLCMYLILYISKNYGKDIRHPQMSFSHNRIHTNVLAYVQKLNNWHAIQHNAKESDYATENKVTQVNSGAISITDVIAVHEPSPS